MRANAKKTPYFRHQRWFITFLFIVGLVALGIAGATGVKKASASGLEAELFSSAIVDIGGQDFLQPRFFPMVTECTPSNFIKMFWWSKDSSTTTPTYGQSTGCQDLDDTFFQVMPLANIITEHGTTSGDYFIYFCDTSNVGLATVETCNDNSQGSLIAKLGVSFDGEGFSPLTEGATTTITSDQTLNTKFTKGVMSAPAVGTTTVTAVYYIDPDEVDVNVASKNPTATRFLLSPSTGTTTYSTISVLNSPTTGVGTTTYTYPFKLPQGKYDLLITFGNAGTGISGIIPFEDSYVYITFSVNASGTLIAGQKAEYYDAESVVTDEYVRQPCGLTDIGGCIANAFAYLFLPSAFTTDDIFIATEEIKTKAPFVYLYQVPDLWQTLYDTAQTAPLSVSASTSIGTVSFISEAQLDAIPLTDTIRTIIGYLLWIMLALTLYTRVRSIFDHQPAT